MELVANVWPVVDDTRLVLRYFMRAYAMDAPDDLIIRTLRALAPTDFLLAHVFRIPEQFEVVAAHGTLRHCVHIEDFRKHQPIILGPAFNELEKSFASLQGVALTPFDSEPIGVSLMPRFPENPYLLTTTVIETPSGRLIPQIQADESAP